MATAPEDPISSPSSDDITARFTAAEKLKVFDGEGKELEFRELYKGQKTIIIFVRVGIKWNIVPKACRLKARGARCGVVVLPQTCSYT